MLRTAGDFWRRRIGSMQEGKVEERWGGGFLIGFSKLSCEVVVTFVAVVSPVGLRCMQEDSMRCAKNIVISG